MTGANPFLVQLLRKIQTLQQKCAHFLTVEDAPVNGFTVITHLVEITE